MVPILHYHIIGWFRYGSHTSLPYNRIVLIGIIFMFTSDVMTYMALVALALRSIRVGLKLQFRLWIVIPRYLNSFTF